MKVFVTGANGLLGSNVVRELIKEGHEVRIFVRPDANMLGLQGVRCDIIKGDLLNEQDLISATAGYDAIIHAAANTSQWPVELRFYEAVNVKGTVNVLTAVKKNNVKKFIYVSTANAFGYGTKAKPGTEQTEYAFHDLKSGYITSKYLAQKLVLDEYKKTGIPAIVVNPTFMIGPYDSKPSSGKIIQMGLNRKIQVFPAGGKNFIHVRDAAIGVCNAINYGQPGECYLLANENLTYREFYNKLNVVADQHPLMVGLPGFFIRSAGAMGSMVEKIINKPLSLNSVNAKLLVIGNYYTGQKAVARLKMPQTGIEAAIHEAIAWWKETGTIPNDTS
jgi:dihydroflavonol-4-reductase